MQRNTGVELELWVVDEQGRLTDGSHLAESHERVEQEFVPPMVEVKTAPHDSESALRGDFQEVLQAALEAAESSDTHLVPLGTPLTETSWSAQSHRGRLFERIYGTGIESAKHCAGTHVHVEQGSVRDQLTVLTALDPALALLASSPYYYGRRGKACARAHAYRTNVDPEFQRFSRLWGYPDSVAEWNRRVASVYETFTDIAADRGVARSEVYRNFAPEDTVLTPVRLRESQPTVEWRAPDAALPSKVLRLAAAVSDLVDRVEDVPVTVGEPEVSGDCVTVPEFARVRNLGSRAIQSGLRSAPVRRYLRSMRFDPSAYDPLTDAIRGPPTIDEERARSIRLQQAWRLRADVERLTAASTDVPSDAHRGRLV